ncbi:hypothetical protein L1285_16890 [Pseudoalteromonas sp. DL2-H2.2]|uniref:hypothetical protein n=1 Tax=Pseudoalteromonas sp. DL2-H2.2 TaxID=2908889 RepID=UPI001F43994E|nr:hypothetical protein [Pseudoalteromonas sp. DL2-H2.2]MCF2909999.1 hypothetical protein [Pseudoalteromonas sp. DL2-H2.2]
MATKNPWKKFSSLLPQQTQFSGKVVAVDTIEKRVKVQRTDGTLWVSGSASLNDTVIATSDGIKRVVTNNNYQRIEV